MREWGVVFSHASERVGGMVDGPFGDVLTAGQYAHKVTTAQPGIAYTIVHRDAPSAPWRDMHKRSPERIAADYASGVYPNGRALVRMTPAGTWERVA